MKELYWFMSKISHLCYLKYNKYYNGYFKFNKVLWDYEREILTYD